MMAVTNQGFLAEAFQIIAEGVDEPHDVLAQRIEAVVERRRAEGTWNKPMPVKRQVARS